MSKEKVLQRVEDILNNNNILKIVEHENTIEVFINTRFGRKKEIIIGDNEVILPKE